MLGTVEHHTSATIDYTLMQPEQESDKLAVFIPGLATNRYGLTSGNEPALAVKDALIDVVGATHNIVFPDIYGMSDLQPGETVQSLVVEDQGSRVLDVLESLATKTEITELTLVSECLGSLVIASLANQIEVQGATALLWSPNTDEGESHRISVITAFGGTEVDDQGNGFLPIAKGTGQVRVDIDLWNSMDRNSLRIYHDAMEAAYRRVIAIYQTEDPIYPQNGEYLAQHTPSFTRVPIPGNKHRFSKEPMKSALKQAMHNIIFGDTV